MADAVMWGILKAQLALVFIGAILGVLYLAFLNARG